MEFQHTSVLLDESLQALALKQIGIYVDGTLGGGGHSLQMLARTSKARVLGIDRDEEALKAAKKNGAACFRNFTDHLKIPLRARRRPSTRSA